MKIKKLSLLFSGIISIGAITPVVYAYSTSKNTKHEMSVKSKILTYIERKTKVDYAYAEKALSNMKISDLLKVTSKEDFDSELTQKIIELQVVPACSALTFASGVTLTIMTFIKLVISKM